MHTTSAFTPEGLSSHLRAYCKESLEIQIIGQGRAPFCDGKGRNSCLFLPSELRLGSQMTVGQSNPPPTIWAVQQSFLYCMGRLARKDSTSSPIWTRPCLICELASFGMKILPFALLRRLLPSVSSLRMASMEGWLNLVSESFSQTHSSIWMPPSTSKMKRKWGSRERPDIHRSCHAWIHWPTLTHRLGRDSPVLSHGTYRHKDSGPRLNIFWSGPTRQSVFFFCEEIWCWRWRPYVPILDRSFLEAEIPGVSSIY